MYETLKKYGHVKVNEPLAKHTTFRIGGPADFLVMVESVEKLVDLLRFLDGEGVPYFMLGGGSNLLVNDDGFRGVVIRLQVTDYRLQAEQVEAAAGVVTVTLAQATMKAGLTGFEWGVGVPGTIGGAVRGNAGAMGGEMSRVVDGVDVYRSGEVITLTNAECEFGYRDSIFKHNHEVVLRARLKLVKGVDQDGIKKAMEFIQYRTKTQPQGHSSIGCIFKNADLEKNKKQLLANFGEADEKIQQFLRVGKISAGWLIERSGLKGRRIGQAKVSDPHGNFIVNLGGAKAMDVLALIDEIKATVYNKFGVELEEEIQVW